MGLLGSKGMKHDAAARFVRMENEKDKLFWTCHTYGCNVTVTHGAIGEESPEFDFMMFATPEEALEKKNSYLERRLQEGYKIAGDQTEPYVPEPIDEPADEPVVSLVDASYDEPSPEAAPVLRAGTPRKRPAAATPGSKRAKAASPKASAKRTPKKAATPKKAPTPKIQKTATPKKTTTPKKALTPKPTAA